MHIYKHMHAWQTPVALTMEQAIVRHAMESHDGVKLLLAGSRGTMLAVLGHDDVRQLLAESGNTRPEDLRGRHVHAHLDGRRVVGISLA